MIPKEDENSDIPSKDQDSFKFIKQALNNLLMDENNQTKKPALLEIEGNEKETSNRDEFDSRFINEIEKGDMIVTAEKKTAEEKNVFSYYE